jgi:hypothetical protein
MLKAILVLAIVCTMSIGASIASAAAGRPGGTQAPPHIAGSNNIVVQQASLTEMLQCLLGPNVVISNATINGALNAYGLFSGGGPALGIPQGIVLSSGNIQSLVGPNIADNWTWDNQLPGDGDLDALIPGFTTHDATVLEFDFRCEKSNQISFQYVFGSEEYNEFVNSPYNDVFGFFLNGVNIATAPLACSNPGFPVAINNVNCGNPYSGLGPNCNCFRNNDLTDGGGSIPTELDGLTNVFFATGPLLPGVNHIKIAIADAGDFVLDSDVMIACQSFECGAPPATGACCVNNDCLLVTQAQCQALGGVYQGDGVACAADLCHSTPTQSSTWGRLKTTYR